MSIIIKGMNMPKIGKSITIYPDGRVVQYDTYTGGTQIGTAISVPPHGRLIDADAVGKNIWNMRASYQMLDNTQTADLIMHGLYRAEQIIEDAPTIIEAEGDE